VLAIVTQSLNQPSETFIRQHVRRIAPGQTALVCFDRRGAQAAHQGPLIELRMPVLPKRAGLWRTAKKAWLFAGRGSQLGLSRRESSRLAAFLSEHGVSVVLAEYGPNGCTVARTCARAGVRLFVHFHGYDVGACQRWHWRVEYRKLAKMAEGIICVSRRGAQSLERVGVPRDKVHIVPCGVDVRQFAPGNERNPYLILAVGRFVEIKAPHRTIEAFAKVSEVFPRARLEMIGGGPLLPMCRNLARELGVSEKIVFHGAKEHDYVRERMCTATVFVQHSITPNNGDTEGLPVGMLEAMAAGLPVVLTRHGGIPEAVVEGVTGFLVDEHDVNGMAVRITELLTDPALRKRMGAAGRRRVIEHFSADRQIRKLREVLGLPR